MTGVVRAFGAGLFLETSAQIKRICGPRDLAAEVQALADEHAELAVSRFVIGEFEHTIIALYKLLLRTAQSVDGQDRPRAFDDLWATMIERLPPRVPSGGKHLSQLGTGLGVHYGARNVRPAELVVLLRGHVFGSWEKFYQVGARDLRDAVLDCSWCCVWPTARQIACENVPGPDCKLAVLCIEREAKFRRAIEVVGRSRSEESSWMRDNVMRLNSLTGLELMREVGRRPGHFGDIIIYWEAPDGWAVLTADDLYEQINRGFPERGMRVLKVRPARIRGPVDCRVRLLKKGGVSESPAQIINYTWRDAAIVGVELPRAKRRVIEVEADCLGGVRSATVMRWSARDDQVTEVGVRLKMLK